MDCCIKMSAICKSGITVSFASRQVCLARFRKPASLSCSLSQVCELHRSRSCEIASCIALAVEQVCDLHRDRTCDTWRCFASVIAVAFASSRNHRDRFRNSREVLCVCSSKHKASSRSWLQTREKHHDCIGRFADATAQWCACDEIMRSKHGDRSLPWLGEHKSGQWVGKMEQSYLEPSNKLAGVRGGIRK